MRDDLHYLLHPESAEDSTLAASQPAADSSPDKLYHACHDPGVTWPKLVIWPDGETVYQNGNELYNAIWQRAMVREALLLGGIVHSPES